MQEKTVQKGDRVAYAITDTEVALGTISAVHYDENSVYIDWDDETEDTEAWLWPHPELKTVR